MAALVELTPYSSGATGTVVSTTPGKLVAAAEDGNFADIPVSAGAKIVIDNSAGAATVDVTVASQQICELTSALPTDTLIEVGIGEIYIADIIWLEQLPLESGSKRITMTYDQVVAVTVGVIV